MSFDGIPVLSPLKSTFFYFVDNRGESDIQNLWSIFELALTLSKNDTEENRQEFNLLLIQLGNKKA